MLRNIIYIMSSIIIFFTGIVIYGVIINLREVTLDEALREQNLIEVVNPYIEIDRRNYFLALYSDTTLVKKYNAVFGRNSGSIKKSSTDFITPVGNFKICKIDTTHIYYKKIYINYPSVNDAAEALREQIISKDEFIAISNSLMTKNCPYQYSELGSDIGIHGIGEFNLVFKNLPFAFNWTNGSIAISNESVDEILSVVKIGTEVIIKN